MSIDITEQDWRAVDVTTDRLAATACPVDDDLYDEIEHFIEFIKPIAHARTPFRLGSLYRQWRDYRGEDIIYSLSLNEVKRIWTAISVVCDSKSLPAYCGQIPQQCILYDNATHRIVRYLKD